VTAWWPKSRVRCRPVKAAKPAAPVVHSASLDWPAAVRQRCAKRSWHCVSRSWRRNTRGAHSFDYSMSCAKQHAVMLSRTLRQVSDLSTLFCRPTAAHLAPFYLAIARHRSVGGLRPAVPTLSFAELRSDKNHAKHPGSIFRADTLQALCRLFGGSCSPDGPKPGRRSCNGCGRCLQVGRRSTTSTRRSFGRVRFCG
jgi:hypothetical protein